MHNSMYIRHINSPSNDEPSKAVNHRFFPPIISSSVRVAMHLGQCVVRGTIQPSTTLGGHVACGSNGILPGLRVQVAYRSPGFRAGNWRKTKDHYISSIVPGTIDSRVQFATGTMGRTVAQRTVMRLNAQHCGKLCHEVHTSKSMTFLARRWFL